MIRLVTNGWVISFLVLAAVSFGLTYGILTLIGSDDDEFVVPINSTVNTNSTPTARLKTMASTATQLAPRC